MFLVFYLGNQTFVHPSLNVILTCLADLISRSGECDSHEISVQSKATGSLLLRWTCLLLRAIVTQSHESHTNNSDKSHSKSKSCDFGKGIWEILEQRFKSYDLETHVVQKTFDDGCIGQQLCDFDCWRSTAMAEHGLREGTSLLVVYLDGGKLCAKWVCGEVKFMSILIIIYLKVLFIIIIQSSFHFNRNTFKIKISKHT